MKNKRLFLSFGIFGIFASLLWFSYLWPQAHEIRFIHPNLNSTENAPTTINPLNSGEGLYWLSFTTKGRRIALDRLILRTKNCINSLTTSRGEWSLPTNTSLLCRNIEGFPLKGTASYLKKATTWYIAGSTAGGGYGVLLDVDWREPPLSMGLAFILLSLALALYGGLPSADSSEKIGVSLLLCATFFLRFWFVFISAPPQLSIFSDMAGYLQRASEINANNYQVSQLFQPIGFTLWSLLLRKLGGFELFNWAQVFLSWGIVLLAYLIARERYGKIAGYSTLLIAGLHLPQAGMATLHMAENIYAFLITFSLWWMLKTLKNGSFKYFVVTGVLLGSAFYFKGNHSFFIPLFSLWILYKDRQYISVGIKKVFALALGVAIVAAPHLAWTARHYGKPYFGPTAGALNFIEGKCPSKNNRDSTGAQWLSPLFWVLGEKEFKQWPRPFTDQAYFWNEGFKCIKNDPAVLATSFRYIYYLFAGNSLWPVTETPLRNLYFSWELFFYYALLPLTMIGALAYARRKEPFTDIAALVVLSLFFTVWFFKSENRFRVPFDAIFIIWAGAGVSYIFVKIKDLTQSRIMLPLNSADGDTRIKRGLSWTKKSLSKSFARN